MIYLLDTNACITYLNVPASRVADRLQALDPSEVAVCSVVKAELYYGAFRSADPRRSQAILHQFLSPFPSLPFDDEAAKIYGRVRADLAARGALIGPYDLEIAAIALAGDLTLVTHITREYSRVVGLRQEDWEIR